MASFNLTDTKRASAISAIAGLRVPSPSISGIEMAIALPTLKPITDEAKQLRQAIGLLLAAVESGDEPTITAATAAFEAYAAPLLKAELIRTGWHPKMASDAEETWLAKAIAAFTDKAVEIAKQRVAQAQREAPNWAR